MDERFQWLPYLAPLLFVEVAIIFLVFFYKRHCKIVRCCGSTENNSNGGLAEMGTLNTPLVFADTYNSEDNWNIAHSQESPDLFTPLPFQSTYTSIDMPCQMLLLFTRLASFVFFVAIGVGLNTVDQHNDYDLKFFTNWNVLLVSLYFTIALIASILGVCRGNTDDGWSKIYRRFAILIHVMFEIAGSTALLVTTVNFSLLDSDLFFWNVVCHLVTSAALVVEALLNQLRVRYDHYPLVLLWYVLYLITIWPLVVTGRVEVWPYPFLALDSWECMLWYTGLILASLFFYTIWWGLSLFKLRIHASIALAAELRKKQRTEELAVTFLNEAAPYGNDKRQTELA